MEPSMHIDLNVIKSLLISRVNEGKELSKSDEVNAVWKKKERVIEDKCRQAMKIIDEAIAISENKQISKEDKSNEVSNKNSEGRYQSAGKGSI